MAISKPSKSHKTFQGRIVQKHDTEANWKKATNFVPLKGEIIIYDDLKKIKIGDGTTKVGDLIFISDLDTIDGKYLPLTGGTITGSLELSSGHLSINDSITLSGGISANTPSLNITNALNRCTVIKGVEWPEDENDAVNRKYVDDQIAANTSSTTIITWTDDGT